MEWAAGNQNFVSAFQLAQQLDYFQFVWIRKNLFFSYIILRVKSGQTYCSQVLHLNQACEYLCLYTTLLSAGGSSSMESARHTLTLNTPRWMVGACQADEKIPTRPAEPSLEKREAAGSMQPAGLLAGEIQYRHWPWVQAGIGACVTTTQWVTFHQLSYCNLP